MKIQEVVALSNQTRIVDVLCPPDPCPSWPDTRSYADIIKLHAENSENDAKAGTLGELDFAKNLADGATVIDIGAGRGNFITNLRQIAQQKGMVYKLVAVGATALDPEHVNNADFIYYQFVPDNDQLLRDYAHQADFVIDTFGAATYAKNPIHALIYSILLLKPGAKYTAISSLIPGEEVYSAFGDINTQQAIIQFFRKHLQLEVSIKPTYLKSKVIGNEGVIVKDLLISCQRPFDCKQEYSLDRCRKLSKLVDKLIGTPEVLGVWSSADFGKFKISKLKYTSIEPVFSDTAEEYASLTL